MVVRLRHLDDAADIGDGLVLGDQLFGRRELAEDLPGCERGAFDRGVFRQPSLAG